MYNLLTVVYVLFHAENLQKTTTYRQLERIMTSIGELAMIFRRKLSICGREQLMAARCWLVTHRMLLTYTEK